MCKGEGRWEPFQKSFQDLQTPIVGTGNSGDVEEQVSGRASLAGAAQGHWSHRAPRRDLRAPGLLPLSSK